MMNGKDYNQTRQELLEKIELRHEVLNSGALMELITNAVSMMAGELEYVLAEFPPTKTTSADSTGRIGELSRDLFYDLSTGHASTARRMLISMQQVMLDRGTVTPRASEMAYFISHDIVSLLARYYYLFTFLNFNENDKSIMSAQLQYRVRSRTMKDMAESLYRLQTTAGYDVAVKVTANRLLNAYEELCDTVSKDKGFNDFDEYTHQVFKVIACAQTYQSYLGYISQ